MVNSSTVLATFEANILFHIYWDGPVLYQSFVMKGLYGYD
jgi:hypothetical protein